MMMSVCESRSNKRKFDEVDGSESDGWTMQQKCFVNQVALPSAVFCPNLRFKLIIFLILAPCQHK